MKSRLLKTSSGFAVGTLLAFNASAGLVDLGPGSFTPAAPVITFDTTEFPLGTTDPSITLAAGSLGNVTVSTAGSFVGQSVYAIHPGVNSISGTPTGPLTLNTAPGASQTFTANDGAPGATSPILSGSPLFNGPISVLFSTPVAAVGLKGGYFDAIGSTEIVAYDANGNVLGDIFNSVIGFQFYGLADPGGADIAGISFYVNGTEPAGFEIDDLTFGAPEQVHITGVPDTSSTIVLLLGSFLGLALVQKRFGAVAC